MIRAGLLAAVIAVGLTAGPGGAAQVHSTEGAAVREFNLTAAPARWEIQPGLVVDGWAYNGLVPGPELRVREGDLVHLHLQNDLPVPTTVHWHGIDVPLAQDGVPGLSQEPVPPGGNFTYEFVATNPGTRWYHSHVDSSNQLELGLYGSFIVEPRQPDPVVYDRDFTYILDEKALDFTPEVALGQKRLHNADTGNGRGGLLDYDLFLVNGRAGDAIPPLQLAQGERIRVRLINAGNLVHAMHLHGHSFTIIATDGNRVPDGQRLVKDTVLIGPGERYDLEIEGTNPGAWMFHCHMPNHQDNGMMTSMVYSGFTLAPAGEQVHGGAHAGGGALPTAPVPATNAEGVSASSVRIVDNRFEPSALSVPVGTTVTWSNTGLNRHTATAMDGSFDTGDMPSGASNRLTFDQPGTYRYYCRQHILGGMLGVIQVTTASP